MRFMGREFKDSSPESFDSKGCPARIPESSRVVVPLFPTSRISVGADRPRSPLPCTRIVESFSSIPMPSVRKHRIVARQSAPSKKLCISVVPFAIQYSLLGGALPNSGNYTMSFNFVSDVGIDYISSSHSGFINLSYTADNAMTESSASTFSFDDSAGSVWFTYPVSLGFQNVMYLSFEVSTLPPLGGRLYVSFVRSDSEPDISAPNSGNVSGDIEQNINNTVGNISSGVSEVSDRISELIQTIINQLDALWNQFSGEFTNMFTAWDTHVQTITNAIQNQGTTVSDGLENVVSEVDSSSDQIVDNADENTDKITQNQDKNTNIITEALSALGNFIIEGLKSLFIPSDDFFQNWYTDLYDFFNDRLGLFMLPIDIVIQLINVYINTDSSFAGIPFPEFKWIDGTVIIPAQTVNFTFLETDWGQDIQQKIYFVTDIFMIFSLLVLLKKKLDEVFVQ